MALKDFLKKAGLVEEDIPVSKPAAKSAPATPQPAASFNLNTSAPQTFTTTSAIDPSINTMLMQSLQDNKLAGFDYLKFTQAVEEMKATGAAEDARYKMAFFAGKQLGVDKPSLVKSGEHYLDVLAQDEVDFNNDCGEYEKKELQSRQSRLTQVETSIADLTKQLAQLQQEGLSLTQEITEQKNNLESRKASFQVTLSTIRATIQSNIQKINQYL